MEQHPDYFIWRSLVQKSSMKFPSVIMPSMYDLTPLREDSAFFEDLAGIPSETECRITELSISPEEVVALARTNDEFQDLVASNEQGIIRGIFHTANIELSLRDAVWTNRATAWCDAEEIAGTEVSKQDTVLSESEVEEESGMYEVLDLPDRSCRQRRRKAEQEAKQRLDTAKNLIGRVDTFEYPESLTEANDIDEFHNDVIRPLVVWFVKYSRMNNDKLDKSLQKDPVSRLEFHRIARAFYRFELWAQIWTLIQHETKEEIAEVASAYCAQFAAWELTQIETVHEFLAWNVAAGCDKLTELSKWEPYRRFPVQNMLAMGLRFVHEFMTCHDEDRRIDMIQNEKISREHRMLFWSEIFNPSKGSDELVSIALSRHPLTDDGDKGAKKAWSRSHSVFSRGFGSGTSWRYRRWGYIFWDEQRLSELGMFPKHDDWRIELPLQYQHTSDATIQWMMEADVHPFLRRVISPRPWRALWDVLGYLRGN